MKIIIVIASIAFLSTSIFANEPPQEKLIIDRDGVQVWTHKEPSNRILNFRARTVLDSTLSGAVALVMDTEHSAEWAPNTGEILMLDRNDQAGTFTLRMDLNFPFPLKNRDLSLTGQLSQATDGVVTIKNEIIVDPRAPVRPNFIRIQQYEGLWTFKPSKSETGKPATEVSVSGYVDPRGLLPPSIVNRFIHQQPFEMLRNMQSYVKAAKYQQATVVGVKEF